MKFVYFNDYQLGAVRDQGVVDLTAVASSLPHRDRQDLILAVIAEFEAMKGPLTAALETGPALPLTDVKLLPPIPRPRQIDCMAVNYMEDGTLAEPAPINGFHKSPSAVIGPGDTMVLPDAPAKIFEGEAELAVVIGKPARNIDPADAMAHVFG